MLVLWTMELVPVEKQLQHPSDLYMSYHISAERRWD